MPPDGRPWRTDSFGVWTRDASIYDTGITNSADACVPRQARTTGGSVVDSGR
jgi:hypothetical protein